MNIRELNYILCIAKHQNLTKAAQELYISQPTLSKHLQKLERDINGKLFSRSGNYYIPTHLGRKYMEYARKMLEINQNWEKELEDLVACNKGELNIAFPPMRSSCMIPHIMPEFHHLYPGVKINFLEESYAIQEKLLLDDQLDFAIFNESNPHPKLTYELLGKEEVLLMLPPGNVHMQDGKYENGHKYPWIDLKLLGEESFILNFPDQTTGRLALQLFEENGIKPDILFHTRNSQAGALLCQQGLGVCLIPENYVNILKSDHPKACFSIGEKGVFTTLVIAYRKDRYMPAYARDFMRIARESMHRP